MGFGKYISEDVFIEFVLVQMASVSQVVDKLSEHLTCQICLEVYKQPKSLPCQHTFCCASLFYDAFIIMLVIDKEAK